MRKNEGSLFYSENLIVWFDVWLPVGTYRRYLSYLRDDISVLLYLIFSYIAGGLTRAFSSRTRVVPPHFACLPLHLARLSSSVTPYAAKSRIMLVVLAKFRGYIFVPIRTAQICMPPGGQLSMRKWRDRECTYSIVGLPAFSDMIFYVPAFFYWCSWMWMWANQLKGLPLTIDD